MATTFRYGIIGIGTNVQYGRRGGYINWDNPSNVFRLLESDGTTPSNVRVATTPLNANDAASKSYVDSLVQGLSPSDSVRAATTGPGTLSTDFENGDTLDGVNLSTGDRILIKDQATASENGIYEVQASGAPVRAADANAPDELGAAFVFVEEGTTHANEGWVTTFNSNDTIGVDPVNWVQFSSTGSFTASNGVQLVSGDFQLDINGLGSTVGVSGADALAFYDTSGSTHQKRTWNDLITDLQIITQGNIVGGIGINVTGTTVSFDNSGMANTPVTPTDTVPFFDTSNAGQPEFRPFSDVISDLNIVTTTNISTTITDGTGIDITGDTISFDRSGMVDTVTTGTDTIPFFDASSANEPEFRAFSDVITDQNIVTTTNISTTVTSGTGIDITGSTVSFDNSGMVDTAVVGGDSVPFFDASNGDEPEIRSLTDIISDLDIRTGVVGVTNGGTGLSSIADNSVLISNAANTLSTLTVVPGNDQLLRWNDGSGSFEFVNQNSVGGASFGSIALSGNFTGLSPLDADSTSDTLNVVGGAGINLISDVISDTLEIELVRDGLTDTATAAGDTVPFFDASSANQPEFRSFSDIITDQNIVTTTNISSTITGGTGIDITGSTVSFDRSGMTNTAVTLSDTVSFFDASASDQPEFRSFSDVLSDLDIVTASANGMLARTAADTYASRTINASSAPGDEGISLVNGNGVSGNPTVGLDIAGLTANITLAGTDEFAVYDGTNNRKITVADFAAGISGFSNGVQVLEGTLGLTGSVIGAIPDNARIVRLRVYIDTAYDNSADIQIHAATSATDIADEVEIDAALVGAYDVEIDYRNTSGSDENIELQVGNGIPTTGAGRIIIEYYRNSGI